MDYCRFATELIEVHFQVYNTRVPVVNPTRFRAQFREAFFPSSPPLSANPNAGATSNTSNTTVAPIHRPLLAAVLAWGSKFSDHTLLVLDRQDGAQQVPNDSAAYKHTHTNNHSNGASGMHSQRSTISRLLVDRAREVAEQEKVYRVATAENIVICILLEGLQSTPSCEFSVRPITSCSDSQIHKYT